MEDVGRHNAVDTLAGEMWRTKKLVKIKFSHNWSPYIRDGDKVAQISLFCFRRVTQMGLDLACLASPPSPCERLTLPVLSAEKIDFTKGNVTSQVVR